MLQERHELFTPFIEKSNNQIVLKFAEFYQGNWFYHKNVIV